MIIHGNYPHTLNGAGGKLPKKRPFQQESRLSSNSYLSGANPTNLLLVFYKAFCHSKWPQVSTDHLTLFGWSIGDEILPSYMVPFIKQPGFFLGEWTNRKCLCQSPEFWSEAQKKRPQRDKNIQKCLLSPIVMEESAIFHLNHQSWEFL